MNGYITASKMTHTELEHAAQSILAKRSVGEIMMKTRLSYGTIFRLRKSSSAREQARFNTLQILVAAFFDDIK